MRFAKIIEAVPRCRLLAEVGCDHAKLTALALSRGLAESAIVSDISERCLGKAKRNLFGFENVTYLVGDGVVTDGRDPDCIMICGMGGHTISGILARYDGGATLVLSPQSHGELVRTSLLENGYRPEIDTCFEADGKFYDLIRAVRGEWSPDAMQIKYGEFYMTKNVALAARLRRLLKNLEGDVLGNAGKIAEIREVLSWQE